MAENVVRGFSYAKGKDFTPFSGEGGADAVPFDGLVAISLAGSATYDAKKNERGETPAMIRVNAVIQDEGDGQGLRLISHLHLDGTDRNGDWMGRQFLEFQHSCGTSVEQIHKNAEAGTNVPDANLIIKKYMDDKRTGYCEIEADVYDGRETTRVKNWITKERYEQAKAIGAHRRKRRTVGTTASPGAGGVNLGGGAAANGATPGQASTPAAGGSSLPML